MELHFSDIVRPAPVVRRPFENLYSPYPIGCSKLCNHPIDKDLKREYKEVIRKTKENLVRKLSRILRHFQNYYALCVFNRQNSRTESSKNHCTENEKITSLTVSNFPTPEWNSWLDSFAWWRGDFGSRRASASGFHARLWLLWHFGKGPPWPRWSSRQPGHARRRRRQDSRGAATQIHKTR